MTSGPPSNEGRLLDGRYRLGSLIGVGGVAEVYRADDERLHRGVAIKLFRGDVAEQLQRHEEEMRTLARLNHGSLVTVYDAGTDDVTNQPYLVMALVEGSTLGDQLRAGPLPPVRTAEIGAAVADALAYVHGQGLVHRDVKPANVLISDAGRVFLADFGIARLVDAAHVTQAGDVLGTPAFFAPEQVSGDPVGPPADVYALGLVLLECLTGRREYDGSTLEVAMARLNRPPTIPPGFPPAWRDLLLGMTAREPASRLSAAQATERLQRIADGDTRLVGTPVGEQATAVIPRPVVAASTMVMPPPPPATTVVASPVAPPSSSRRFWIVLLILVLVIVAAAAVAYAVVQNNKNSGAAACSAGTSGLSGQLQLDMSALNGAACSNDVAAKAAAVFSPDLAAVRTATSGASRRTLRAQITQLLDDTNQLQSNGQISQLRQQAVENAAAALQLHFLAAHPAVKPSSAAPSTSPPVTPSESDTPPPTPTVTKTVTAPPTSPPVTGETSPPDTTTASP